MRLKYAFCLYGKLSIKAIIQPGSREIHACTVAAVPATFTPARKALKHNKKGAQRAPDVRSFSGSAARVAADPHRDAIRRTRLATAFDPHSDCPHHSCPQHRRDETRRDVGKRSGNKRLHGTTPHLQIKEIAPRGKCQTLVALLGHFPRTTA